MTHRQVDRLAEQMPGQDGLLVVFLCYTGLRMSEVVALTPTSVDLATGAVTVSQAAVELGTPGARRLVMKGTKTGRVRVVPMPSFVRLALVEGHRPGPVWFFTEPGGGMLCPSKFRGRVLRAGRRAGLGHVTPKQFRDTAASLAIQAGASVKMVQGLLGHTSAVVTLDRYAALFPEDLGELSRRLGEARRLALSSD